MEKLKHTLGKKETAAWLKNLCREVAEPVSCSKKSTTLSKFVFA